MSTNQNDRVLRALTKAGERGITRVDFQAPDVIDGGKPILNFPARIQDLEEDGYTITAGERRNRCTVYRLVGAASETSNTRPGPLPPAAFATPAPPRPALGTWHCCDKCGATFKASWPRECPECNAPSLWLASFHDEVTAHRYIPKAVTPIRKDIAA